MRGYQGEEWRIKNNAKKEGEQREDKNAFWENEWKEKWSSQKERKQ